MTQTNYMKWSDLINEIKRRPWSSQMAVPRICMTNPDTEISYEVTTRMKASSSFFLLVLPKVLPLFVHEYTTHS